MEIDEQRLIYQILDDFPSLVRQEIALTELDIQFLLVYFIKRYYENLNEKSASLYNMSFFNCVYLGKEFKINAKIFPDILVFKNDNLHIIIEIKFFRPKRPFSKKETEHDIEKLKSLLKRININNKQSPVIGIDIIIDSSKNNRIVVNEICTKNTIVIAQKKSRNLTENTLSMIYIYAPILSNKKRYDRIIDEISRIQK